MELTGNFLPLLSIDYTNFVLSLHSLMANKRLRSDDANSNGDRRIHYVTTVTSSMNLNDDNTLQWKQASAIDNMVTIMGSIHWQTMSRNYIWTSGYAQKGFPKLAAGLEVNYLDNARHFRTQLQLEGQEFQKCFFRIFACKMSKSNLLPSHH